MHMFCVCFCMCLPFQELHNIFWRGEPLFDHCRMFS